MDHRQAIATHAAERYLLNELNDADRNAFEDHYFTCVTCAEDVKAGAQMQQGIRGGMLDKAGVAQSAKVIPIQSRRRSTMSVVMPWAIAATLALVAGYQALFVVPALRQDSLEAGAAVPVLLKPASRGELATVTLSRAGVIAF